MVKLSGDIIILLCIFSILATTALVGISLDFIKKCINCETKQDKPTLKE